jgi:hypothetical protein
MNYFDEIIWAVIPVFMLLARVIQLLIHSITAICAHGEHPNSVFIAEHNSMYQMIRSKSRLTRLSSI